MRTSWRLMKWRGVPIVLDWTMLIGLPWFYFRHRSLIGMATAFVAFFFLMLIHEIGHAAVAKWRKVPVFEIRLLIMHGLCRHEVPYRQSDAIWIAWGGVAAQAVVLLVALGVSELLRAQVFLTYIHAQPVLRILIETNIIIILLNLVPVPPLDGATAWRALPMLWERVPHSRLNAKRWLREWKLKRQSKEVTADIIERLKKRQ